MASFGVGLTMYSVRKAAADDYLGTMRKVAKMGYRGIQTHFLAADPAEMLAVAKEEGAQVCGAHIAIAALRDQMDEVIAYCKALECRDVTCPYLPDEYRTEEGYKVAAGILNEAGKQLKDAGLRLTYHNHSFEFAPVGDTNGFEILFGALDTEVVGAELDVYWLKHGGQDPAAYIRRFSGRLPLLHLKDMEPGDERFYAEVGEGILDWPGIFAAAEEAGVEWAIVEQDDTRRTEMESAELSIRNLRKMGIA